ncbi:MAG TPA: MraY family glycosyltransferase [Phycisphaerae bacterium]|nr:MraY family glycosyltransferase [Phycisphaerae bacterium]HNU44094.1 MraY family glycosyltransferase [Phycisphaerae bacterium]
MVWIVACVILVPLSLSLLATRVVRRVAIQVGFVDRPAGHKQHSRPTALGGGVALMLAIFVPVLGGLLALTLLPRDPPPPWLPALLQTHLSGVVSRWPSVAALFGGALLLHVVGLIDDRRPLGPGVKFLAQFVAAAVVAGPLGIRAAEFLPTPLATVLTILWIVLITNAFNFLDNMDGLSAGVAAVAAAVLAVASMGANQIFVPVLAWVMVGALLGFLWFNFSPASIFMGDAGSMPIGYLLAVLTILTTYYDPDQQRSPFGVLVPPVVLAVPMYDVASVVVRRLRLGISPFRGDRRHFSHRLVQRGMSPRRAVLTIYLATAATALPAVILPRLSWAFATLLLLQCVSVVALIATLEYSPSLPPGPDERPNQATGPISAKPGPRAHT